jgi:SNF family Na+-dependent transporter
LIFSIDKGKIAELFTKHLMQDYSMSRWLSPLMAFCLSFIIIAGLAPSLDIQIDRQIDFWILWLVSMLVLALPITYLEVALAKRSKTTALNALSSLTRDADASQSWRIVGWLAVIFIPFLAGGILSNISQSTVQMVNLPIQSHLLFAGAAVMAFALSFAPRQILVGLITVGVLLSLILAQVFGTHLQTWHVTPLEFKEWGNATILALVATGLGLGLYWQTSLLNVQQNNEASKTALPIWIAQLVAVIAFSFFAASAQIPAYTLLFTAVISAALLLQLGKEQLAQRQVAILIQFVVLLVALFIWAIPNMVVVFNPLLMIWGLVICFIYSIFVGWIMKISHLRKAINFSSEAFYNIWRIAVRIILPLSIVLALVSYIGQLI